MVKKDKLTNFLIFIAVLVVVSVIGLMILNRINIPFKECESKNYTGEVLVDSYLPDWFDNPYYINCTTDMKYMNASLNVQRALLFRSDENESE